MGRHYDAAMQLCRDALRERGDFVGAHRVLTAAAGMAGQLDVAARRPAPNAAARSPTFRSPGSPPTCRCEHDADLEHYLEGLRRAGLK